LHFKIYPRGTRYCTVYDQTPSIGDLELRIVQVAFEHVTPRPRSGKRPGAWQAQLNFGEVATLIVHPSVVRSSSIHLNARLSFLAMA